MIGKARSLAARSADVESVANAAPKKTFRVGLRSRTGSVSTPIGRLEFFNWGIRMGAGGRLTQRLIPIWEARYDELAMAQRVSAPIANHGVRFSTPDHAEPIVFWSSRYSEILDHLDTHGVPV